MADDGLRSSHLASRRANFKKTVDEESGRRQREEHAVRIRKEKKQDRDAKKRQQLSATVGDAPLPAHHITQAQYVSLVNDVFSGDEARAYTASETFRKMLSSEKHPPIEAVMRLGVAPKFVEFLSCDHNPKLQFEAAWALTNIASGTTQQTMYVIQLGAVPHFVRLLDSPNPDVREQAVWALGNIAGDGPEFRDVVLAAGAIVPLTRHMHHQAPLCFIRNSVWTISNFCRGKPPAEFSKVAPLLPTLASAIYSGDAEILTDALWTLSYLSDGDNARVQTCVEAGITGRVVQLLVHQLPSVQVPALRTVGNIVTGDDIQTQLAINAGALPCLLMLLNTNKKAVKKEAAWTISNIMAGNKDQIAAVIDCNIVHVIVGLLNTGDYEIRKEAVWCISNATSGGTAEQMAFLVRCGAIPPLVDTLALENDTKMVTVALEGIENILKSGDAKYKVKENAANVNPYVEVCTSAGLPWHIQTLMECNHKALADKATKIMDEYFPHEYDDFGVEDLDGGGRGEPLDAEDPHVTSSSVAQQFQGAFHAAGQAPAAAAAAPAAHFQFGMQQQQQQQYPPQQQQQAMGAAAPAVFGAVPPPPPPQPGAPPAFNFNYSFQ